MCTIVISGGASGLIHLFRSVLPFRCVALFNWMRASTSERYVYGSGVTYRQEEADPVFIDGLLRMDQWPAFTFQSGSVPGIWFTGRLDESMSHPCVRGRLSLMSRDTTLGATLDLEQILTVYDDAGSWFRALVPLDGHDASFSTDRVGSRVEWESDISMGCLPV